MNLKSILTFSFFGAFLLFTGYQIGGINDKAVQEKEKQIYNFLLTVAIPLGIAGVNHSVNKEIEEKAEKEIDKRLVAYQNNHCSNLEKIKGLIESSSLPPQVRNEYVKQIDISQTACKQFIENYEIAQKITKWLSDRKNRLALVDTITVLAQQRHQISSKSLPAFRQDMARCINWLRDSIQRLNGYQLERNEVTKALSPDLTDGLEVYKTALNALKYHDQLGKLSGNSRVVEDFVDELIRLIE